jgi:hypothetical protein
MREKGVRVLTVREILAFGTADHVGARLELEEFAMQVGSAAVLQGVLGRYRRACWEGTIKLGRGRIGGRSGCGRLAWEC